jgi:hypothetical protein
LSFLCKTSLKIPQEWEQGAWRLLIRLPEERELDAEDAHIVCCTTFLQSQDGPDELLRLLDICDPQDVREMIEESRRGKAGWMRLSHNGVDSLWAYGSSERGGSFPILVVPYQRIVQRATSAQQMLFRDNIRAIQIAAILIFTIIVAAVVLVGTDGIWEALNPSGRMCGKKRLIDLIDAHKDKFARQIVSSVVESVLDFCSDTAPTDDVTLLAIKCTR